VQEQEELLCVKLFGLARGAEVVELVERTTGELCPCRRGLVCPLLARLEVVSTTEPVSA
jgi:hypothetical protein